tara:strand:+ start:1943 stop:2338 length:396 start_codon:yes stop_codon:yes gene_type:complete
LLNLPEEILKKATSDVGILVLRKDDIITFEPKPEKTEQTLDSMKEDFEVFKQWSKEKKYGFLVDSRRFSKFDYACRVYAQKNCSQFSNKYAIIISSGISSFIGNIFMYLNKPDLPTKLFSNKADALDWLKK